MADRHEDHGRKIFWFLVVCAIGSIALYIYAIASSVAHVVLREEIEKDISERNARIASLEAVYLAKADAITENEAKMRGFVDIAQKQYVARTGTAFTVNR